MKQSDLEALLGRSLTSREVTNQKLYLKIANEHLQSLLCYTITDNDQRIYESRPGYRSLFVEPFTEIKTVSVDDDETTNYTVKQWDSRSADWYNVIEFKNPMKSSLVTVEADWGFGNCMPNDLRQLLAKLFDLVSRAGKDDSRVKSKAIERSFSVTYKDGTVYKQIVADFQSVIAKYSLCGLGEVRHGND